MTINDKSFYKSEFEHIYHKNAKLIGQDNEKDTDQYLQMFIDYKLKVAEAKNRGLDTLKPFLKQYDQYKSQITDKYLMNTKVNASLLREAYQREQEIINANHILIHVSEDASPADTLTAYQRALEVKKKVDAGESFEKLAAKYSDDPSAKKNKGYLGWFSVFKMVYPFENAAYKTKVGEVSNPVRSKFGYHIIKVNDRRKAIGKVSLAQIYIADKDSTDAKEQIDKIYQKLKNGADFGDMAKQFSDNKSSAKNGGKLRPLAPIDVRFTEIQNVIFKLSKKNPLSEPFYAKTGWHILKWLNQEPLKSFDKEKRELESKIRRSDRSSIVQDSLIKTLKNKYTIEVATSGLDYFKTKLGDSLTKLSEKDLPNTPLLQIENDKIPYSDFLKQIQAYLHYNKGKLTEETLENIFDKFKDFEVLTYQKKHLSEENHNYAQDLKDYREGVLIFDLMQKEVWDKANDSLALSHYYNTHQTDFKTQKKYEVVVFSSDSKKEMKKIRKELKKSVSETDIKKTFPNVMTNSGEWSKDDNRLPKKYKGKKGISNISKHNGVFMVIQTKAVKPSRILNLEENRGEVMNAYQDKLEKDFTQKLRQKYQVDINQETLKELKK